jgi:hypothetical protein
VVAHQVVKIERWLHAGTGGGSRIFAQQRTAQSSFVQASRHKSRNSRRAIGACASRSFAALALVLAATTFDITALHASAAGSL